MKYQSMLQVPSMATMSKGLRVISMGSSTLMARSMMGRRVWPPKELRKMTVPFMVGGTSRISRRVLFSVLVCLEELRRDSVHLVLFQEAQP